MMVDLDMQRMAVFGRVVNTVLRNAQQDWTVSAKNTHRSIKEQTERPPAVKVDGLYPAANGELVNFRKLHMATSSCIETYGSEPALLVSAHGRTGEYWPKAYINSASEAIAVVLQC